MDTLRIERTEDNPQVVFEPDEFQLSINGPIRQQNPAQFFNPIQNWLDEFLVQHPKNSTVPLSVEVRLYYCNTAAIKHLTELFIAIQKIHNSGIKVLVEWYFKDDDDLIRELGQEISDACELPFIFIDE